MEEAVMAAASRNGIAGPQSMLVLYCLKPPLQPRLIYSPTTTTTNPLTYTLNQPCTAFVHKLCDNLVTARWSFSSHLVVL